MLRLTRPVLLGCSLLVLAGCSQMALVYNRIDWLAPFYINDYVSLDRGQTRLLKQELLELRDWHCGTQLSSYVQWTQALESDLQSQSLTPQWVATRYHDVREALRQLVAAASPGTAALVLTLSPDQEQEFFERLERENDEFAATFVDAPSTQAQHAYAKRMRKQLSEWIGGLTEEQERRVQAWSEQVTPGAADRLRARRAWQDELRRLLKRRDQPGFESELRKLIAYPDRFKPDQYRKTRDAYRGAMIALLGDVAVSLTPRQRDRLLTRAASWRRDFERLACAPAPSHAGEPPPLGGGDGVSKIFFLNPFVYGGTA